MHFTVGDAKHVRFEGLHPAAAPVPSNSVRVDARRSARLLESVIEKMKHADATSFYLEPTDAKAKT